MPKSIDVSCAARFANEYGLPDTHGACCARCSSRGFASYSLSTNTDIGLACYGWRSCTCGGVDARNATTPVAQCSRLLPKRVVLVASTGHVGTETLSNHRAKSLAGKERGCYIDSADAAAPPIVYNFETNQIYGDTACLTTYGLKAWYASLYTTSGAAEVAAARAITRDILVPYRRAVSIQRHRLSERTRLSGADLLGSRTGTCSRSPIEASRRSTSSPVRWRARQMESPT